MAPATERDHPVLGWLRRLYLVLSVVTFVLVGGLVVGITAVPDRVSDESLPLS